MNRINTSFIITLCLISILFSPMQGVSGEYDLSMLYKHQEDFIILFDFMEEIFSDESELFDTLLQRIKNKNLDEEIIITGPTGGYVVIKPKITLYSDDTYSYVRMSFKSAFKTYKNSKIVIKNSSRLTYEVTMKINKNNHSDILYGNLRIMGTIAYTGNKTGRARVNFVNEKFTEHFDSADFTGSLTINNKTYDIQDFIRLFKPADTKKDTTTNVSTPETTSVEDISSRREKNMTILTDEGLSLSLNNTWEINTYFSPALAASMQDYHHAPGMKPLLVALKHINIYFVGLFSENSDLGSDEYITQKHAAHKRDNYTHIETTIADTGRNITRIITRKNIEGQDIIFVDYIIPDAGRYIQLSFRMHHSLYIDFRHEMKMILDSLIIVEGKQKNYTKIDLYQKQSFYQFIALWNEVSNSISAHKHDRALELMKQAIEMNYTYPILYYRMGRLYAGIDNNVNAIKYFEKALAMNEEYVQAYFGIARCYVELKNVSEAKNNFEQALRLSPDSISMLYMMIDLLFKAEEYEEARRYIIRYKASFENNKHYYLPQQISAYEESLMIIDHYSKVIEKRLSQ